MRTGAMAMGMAAWLVAGCGQGGADDGTDPTADSGVAMPDTTTGTAGIADSGTRGDSAQAESDWAPGDTDADSASADDSGAATDTEWIPQDTDTGGTTDTEWRPQDTDTGGTADTASEGSDTHRVWDTEPPIPGDADNVTLLFPDNNEVLTDIAVSFKAKIPGASTPVLQVSPVRDYSSGVVTRPAQTGKGEIAYDTYYFLTYQGIVTPNDRFVLTPGKWYWRVSGDGGATFSETRILFVVDDKPRTPVERPISPAAPLFHMRLRSQLVDYAPNGDIAGVLKQIVPDALKPYVVLDLGHSFPFLPKERSLYEYSKIFDDLGYNYLFDLGSHAWLGRIASLGEMEVIFRELPHCVGAVAAEEFYYIYNEEADRSMLEGALELARKYGKRFLWADMNWKWARWQQFAYIYYDRFRERHYGDYFVPLFKTTDPWGAYTNISAMQGMVVSGMVADMGIWSDFWCWEKFGQVNTLALEDFLTNRHESQNEKTFPFIQNIKQYIYGITVGATVFALESNLQWHWQTAVPNDHFYRYLEPFVTAVVREGIVPSRRAITDSFHIVVDTQFPSGDAKQTPPLTYVPGNIWGNFLRATFGIADIFPYNEPATSGGETIIQAAYAELFPNADRYPSGIPFLPKPGIPAPVVNGRTLDVVPMADLDTPAEVEARLNPYYPPTGNQAYARKIDRSVFVFNTAENHDIVQSYAVDLDCGRLGTLHGDIHLMSYVIGKCRADDKTQFFQVNAYVPNDALVGGRYALPAYPTVLHIQADSRPVVESAEMEAFVRQQWDPDTHTLTVEIDHTQAGAVDFTVR